MWLVPELCAKAVGIFLCLGFVYCVAVALAG
jgi:hypothetical protein